MSSIVFRYCPLCSRRLERGKLILPHGNSVTGYVWWYSEEKVIVRSLDDCVGLFQTMHGGRDGKTFSKSDIPAGFCEKCDRIFAEFEVVNWEKSHWRK
ncbi:MAG: PF20097 family protein [Ruminococcus flavefaciens]|nr:PF20097 family protein [Ruminococcus flavefaciens]